MNASTLGIISYICYGLCVLFTIVSIFIYFQYNIKDARDTLSGKTLEKALEQMRASGQRTTIANRPYFDNLNIKTKKTMTLTGRIKAEAHPSKRLDVTSRFAKQQQENGRNNSTSTDTIELPICTTILDGGTALIQDESQNLENSLKPETTVLNEGSIIVNADNVIIDDAYSHTPTDLLSNESNELIDHEFIIVDEILEAHSEYIITEGEED